MSWTKKMLGLAMYIAGWSKDTTRVGAVATDPRNAVVAQGYNGPPPGVADWPERFVRPAKYLWCSHAEENLVAHAARPVLAGTTVTVTHCACARCARLLITAGVAKVVFGPGKTHMEKVEFEVARTMFREAGVEVEDLDG